MTRLELGIPTRLWALSALGALSSLSCNVFDESLIPPSAVTQIALADDCGGSVPLVPSQNTDVEMDTTDLKADLANPGCMSVDNLSNLKGNDGFFAVDMQPNQWWHFHVKVPKATPNIDPVVYVMQKETLCREGSCLAGLNACGPGKDEHFSFFSEARQQVYVGVGSVGPTPAGAPFTVYAIQATCGANGKEHPESCDPSAALPADRAQCDPQCRKLLDSEHATATEPNDEPLVNANVILPDSNGELTVTGTLGEIGSCDYESFALSVAANSSVHAVVTLDLSAVDGGACPTLVADLFSQVGPNHLSSIQIDSTQDTADCSLTVSSGALPRGTYFLRFTTAEDALTDKFPYHLALSGLSSP